jgi:hypothetical protein
MMEDRTDYIRVTSHLDKTFKGRYAGKDYTFKPEVPVDMPELAVRHIFDFGNEDKTRAVCRLGWAQNSDGMEEALAKLAKVSFDDPPEMIEAPVQPKKRKRASEETGTAGPPVTAGGTEGGVLKSPPDGPKIGQDKGADDTF